MKFILAIAFLLTALPSVAKEKLNRSVAQVRSRAPLGVGIEISRRLAPGRAVERSEELAIISCGNGNISYAYTSTFDGGNGHSACSRENGALELTPSEIVFETKLYQGQSVLSLYRRRVFSSNLPLLMPDDLLFSVLFTGPSAVGYFNETKECLQSIKAGQKTELWIRSNGDLYNFTVMCH